MASEQQRFAFGENRIGTVCCPGAFVMGTNTVHTRILREYDEYLREETGEQQGTVPPSKAKEAWQHAMRRFRERNEHVTPHDALDVTRQLGWEANDEHAT